MNDFEHIVFKVRKKTVITYMNVDEGDSSLSKVNFTNFLKEVYRCARLTIQIQNVYRHLLIRTFILKVLHAF